MELEATIEDAGPCKKHIRVRIPQHEIEHYYLDSVGEMIDTVAVPGFRVGHVPVDLVKRRFKKELYDQVKQKVLVESLEQLAEDYEIDPINEPNLDIETLDISGDRDFEYEFEVEVRPEFELPDYEGLVIRRPAREITDADIDAYLERFLSQYGKLVPREGPAEKGDIVTVSAEFDHQGRPVRHFSELALQLKPVLRFQDAEITGFDDLMFHVQPGDIRETELVVSDEAETIPMRGEIVHARFEVGDVSRMELPELNKEFLQRVGVESVEELRAEVRKVLDRQVTYQQRQSARAQVLEKITASADWELPENLVVRQVENAMRREILEMQQAGFTTQEIRARENRLRQHAISTTRQALKEHFVLDKIATLEAVEVTPADIDFEIRLMALQRGESPRRVRARLQKSGMIENLEAQIRERKAIDTILERAQYEDVEMEPFTEEGVEAVSHSICGSSLEPIAAGPSEPEAEET